MCQAVIASVYYVIASKTIAAVVLVSSETRCCVGYFRSWVVNRHSLRDDATESCLLTSLRIHCIQWRSQGFDPGGHENFFGAPQ
jgi:hypothetical protein